MLSEHSSLNSGDVDTMERFANLGTALVWLLNILAMLTTEDSLRVLSLGLAVVVAVATLTWNLMNIFLKWDEFSKKWREKFRRKKSH